MRLWSIHPRYLDSRGLVASWREGLLAQKVLTGTTKGYKDHPQLIRFLEFKTDNLNQYTDQKDITASLVAIGAWLKIIQEEATDRGFKFNSNLIVCKTDLLSQDRIPITQGQLQYEFGWLLFKLSQRDPVKYNLNLIENIKQDEEYVNLKIHPCFVAIEGKHMEAWERVADFEKEIKRQEKVEIPKNLS
ncbi:hypothetical protein AKO1_012120 [Acrasis kona]|uniref:Pyrimidine dimer DNA glycosylase n=1 Tax=Acrasis kona TaxID=1008807 RepID=A0AAW2ZA87_9EUKA